MKTLLIYPPYSPLSHGFKNQEIGYVYLGLPSLAAYLQKEGHEVSILDLNIKMYFEVQEEDKMLWHDDNYPFWMFEELFFSKVLPKIKSLQEKWVDVILESNPKIIGFYISFASRWIALSLAKRLKEKNSEIAIIFGGPECFKRNIEIFLKSGWVDAVVTGEGEVTLLELVNSCEKTGTIKPCSGAFFIRNGEIIDGGKRELIKDLDTLPYPDFSDIIDDYKTIFGDKTWLSISWIRGCTHKCAFCYDTKFWKTPRPRSPESICREFIFQKQKYNIAVFNKGDPILAFSEDLLFKTCDLLIEKKADVIWGSQARADKYLTLEALQKLYKAGCRYLWYGVESGSQSVVDRMNKGFQVKTAQNIIINTKKAGIQLNLFIMVGSPGETVLDFIKTLWFIIKNRNYIDDICVASAALIPEIDWFLEPEKYGIVMDKKRYWLWRTKYYFNNRYRRDFESHTVKALFKMLSK